MKIIYAIIENVNMSEKSGCNQRYKGGYYYDKQRNKKNNQNERKFYETSEFWKNN